MTPQANIKRTSLRDQIGWLLASLGLRIASPRYRLMVQGAIQYGLDAAVRDEREGRSHPENWRDQAARAK